MTLSLKIIGIITLALLMNVFAFAQESKPNQTKQLTVCPFQIAEAGRAASFRLGFNYQLETDAAGKVQKVTEMTNPRRSISKFVHHELFVDCMKQWQLEPAGKYFVLFYVGTTSIGTKEEMPFNYMRIVDPNKKVLIVELSFSETDILKINEPKKGQ